MTVPVCHVYVSEKVSVPVCGCVSFACTDGPALLKACNRDEVSVRGSPVQVPRMSAEQAQAPGLTELLSCWGRGMADFEQKHRSLC